MCVFRFASERLGCPVAALIELLKWLIIVVIQLVNVVALFLQRQFS
jgi:hypothetical protein